jgi:tol-pal system protein YbgF
MKPRIASYLFASAMVIIPIGTVHAQSAQSTAQVNMRVDRLEGQIRQLTGQIEELTFQMRQMQEQLQRSREDSEYRLQNLEGGAATGSINQQRSDAGSTIQSGASSQTGSSLQGQTQPSSHYGQMSHQQSQQQFGIPSSTLGRIPAAPSVPHVNGSGDPFDLSTITSPPSVATQTFSSAPSVSGNETASIQLPSSDPRDVYDLAYGYVLRGDYQKAEDNFADFIETYPGHTLQPNATFWYGESLFAQGDYTDAAGAFLRVYNDYPNSEKVPDSLLKLAMSLNELGQKGEACATFDKVVTEYPQASGAVRRMAVEEQAQAGC